MPEAEAAMTDESTDIGPTETNSKPTETPTEDPTETPKEATEDQPKEAENNMNIDNTPPVPDTPKLAVRFILGAKRKVKKLPIKAASDEMLVELVVKSLPELAGQTWHLEFDEGCWIESAEDWNLAVEMFSGQEVKAEEGQKAKFFEVYVVPEQEACKQCVGCECKGQKSQFYSGHKSPLPPNTHVPLEAPSGNSTPASPKKTNGEKRKLSALPPPLTDEEHEKMDSEKPPSAKKPMNDGWKSGAAASAGWKTGPVAAAGASAKNASGFQTGAGATLPFGFGPNTPARGGAGRGGFNTGTTYGAGARGRGMQRGRAGFQRGGARGTPMRGRGGAARGNFGGGGFDKKASHDQQAQEMRQNIIEIMRKTGQPMSMLWVRKQIANMGYEKPTTKTVNWHLYQMQEQGIARRQENNTTKPDWVLL